jgi:hypothetical protein
MGSVIVNDSVMSILNVQEVLSLSGLGNFDDPAFVHDPQEAKGVISLNQDMK